MPAPAPERHDALETGQLVVAIATGVIGLLYYFRGRKPAGGGEEPAVTTTPTGPAGFGEVPGGGGGGGATLTAIGPEPKAPKTGEQTVSSGNETPAEGRTPSPPVGKLVPKSKGPNPNGPLPGQGQAEWERERLDWRTTNAQPGLARAQRRALRATPAVSG